MMSNPSSSELREMIARAHVIHNIQDRYYERIKAGESTGGALLEDYSDLGALIAKEVDKAVFDAEVKMGQAVIERMRQANYQWEKAQSFIESYQIQKRENIHNLKALKKAED